MANVLTFRKGKRVVLRPVMESDLRKLLIWINDPEVTQFLKAYLPKLEGDEKKWIEDLGKRMPNDIVFIIEVIGETTGKDWERRTPIGVMGLHRIDWKDRTATTGALIGEKEFWGKGYGSEAKMLLLDYAFNTLNLRKICSGVIEYNKRSVAYSMKCGYKIEGRLKKHFFAEGRYWDEILLAIFKPDFQKIWKNFRKTWKFE